MLIDVVPVNDPPSFVSGPLLLNFSAAVAPTGASQLVFTSPWASSISAGPANEASQQVAFEITPLDSFMANSLFAHDPMIDPSTGELSVTATSAGLAGGSVTYSVVLQDDGGTADGGSDSAAPVTLTLSVVPVPLVPVSSSAFPIWLIGVIVGLIFFLLLFIILWRRYRNRYPLEVDLGTAGDTCASFYLAPTQKEMQAALGVLKKRMAVSPPGMNAPMVQPATPRSHAELVHRMLDNGPRAAWSNVDEEEDQVALELRRRGSMQLSDAIQRIKAHESSSPGLPPLRRIPSSGLPEILRQRSAHMLLPSLSSPKNLLDEIAPAEKILPPIINLPSVRTLRKDPLPSLVRPAPQPVDNVIDLPAVSDGKPVLSLPPITRDQHLSAKERHLSRLKALRLAPVAELRKRMQHIQSATPLSPSFTESRRSSNQDVVLDSGGEVDFGTPPDSPELAESATPASLPGLFDV